MLPFDPFIYTPYQYATVGQSVLTITKPMLADLVCFQSDSLWHVYRLNLAPNQWCYSFLCSAQIHHKLSCPHHTRSMHSSAWTSTNIVILLFTFSELFLVPQHCMPTVPFQGVDTIGSLNDTSDSQQIYIYIYIKILVKKFPFALNFNRHLGNTNAVSCQISKWYIALKSNPVALRSYIKMSFWLVNKCPGSTPSLLCCFAPNWLANVISYCQYWLHNP